MAEHASQKGYQHLRGHVVCPHCWHRFETPDVVWIARHEDLRGDPIVGRDAFMRFRPSRFNVAGRALDARGLACEELACPNCHLSIPWALLESEPLIFSIIGVPYSGKSYFLAAMTWELRQLLPMLFSIVFADVDPGNNIILNEYEKTLFLQSDPETWVGLLKTQLTSELYDQVLLGDQNVSLPHPFLFTLRPMGQHPDAGAAEEMSRVLCFYDNAGEHFQPGQDKSSSPGTQHLARSRVLIFVYDPTKDPRFRKRCREFSQDPQLFGVETVDRQETILTEAALRVRTYAGLSPNRKLGKPLIVVVAKADVWGKLLGEELPADPYVKPDDSGRKLAYVDSGLIDNMSQKIRNIMLDIAPEFVAVAEDSCQRVIYVPTSALGTSPVARDDKDMLVVRPKDIQPKWVTVPILYAFAKWSKGLVASAPAG